MNEQNLAYTVNQFTVALNISRSTLYSLWRDGQGPKFIKVGNRTLIPRESATQWMQNLAQQETAIQLAANNDAGSER